MMRCRMRYTGVAGLALVLASTAARAEPLIYVMGGVIGTIDSSNPAVDTTPGNNGPLGYTLPGNFATYGAKVSDDGQTLYLLGYSPATNSNTSTTCELFSVDTQGANGVAGISAVNDPYPCSLGLTAGYGVPFNGDLDFVRGSGTSSVLDAYVVATAEVGTNSASYQILPGGASNFGTAPVIMSWNNLPSADNGTANLIGVADMSTVSATEQTGYGIDANAGVVQLDLQVTPESVANGTPESIAGTETVIASQIPALQGFSLNQADATSFDYSPATGTYYLYIANAIQIPNPFSTFPGQTIASAAIYAASSLSSDGSSFAMIGSPPGALNVTSANGPEVPIAVVAAKGLTISNNNPGDGGGAFGPGCLAPLALLAALRRRRPRAAGN